MTGRLVPAQSAPAAPIIYKPFAGANRHQRRARKHRAPTNVERMGKAFTAAMGNQQAVLAALLTTDVRPDAGEYSVGEVAPV